MKKYTIDAKEKRLGRVASEAAIFLMGKNNSNYARNLVADARVEITGVSMMDFSQKKLKDKIYTHYTGYPSGLRKERAEEVVAKKGYRELMRKAVFGMLPGNKLRSKMMKNLIIHEK